MNGFLKAGAMIALAVLCCGFLPGCGERGAERKIVSAAKTYIKEKYGFSPEITGFQFRHVGELEWNSHKKDAGYVTMTHDGREFKAYISPKDPDVNCDNFMQKDVDDRLAAYFREQLDCQDIAVETTYGSFIRCGVPADIRSYEELFAGCDNICIYVSAYALDREKVSALDVSKLGKRQRSRWLSVIRLRICRTKNYGRRSRYGGMTTAAENTLQCSRRIIISVTVRPRKLKNDASVIII